MRRIVIKAISGIVVGVIFAALVATVAYLDLLPPLRAVAESGEDLYFPGTDVHWTPEGHAAVAEALRGWLAGD